MQKLTIINQFRKEEIWHDLQILFKIHYKDVVMRYDIGQ